MGELQAESGGKMSDTQLFYIQRVREKTELADEVGI